MADEAPRSMYQEDNAFEEQKKRLAVEQLKDAEKSGQTNEASSLEDETIKNRYQSVSKAEDKRPWKFSLRGKKKPGAVTITAVVLLGLAALFSPSLLLVNVKEKYVNDLNDITGASMKMTANLMKYQIGRAPCPEDSIKCKFQTVSEYQKRRYDTFGLNPTALKQPDEDRYTIVSLAGKNGTALLKAMQSDNRLNANVNAAFNLKTGLFFSRKFNVFLEKRYGIDLSENTLKNVRSIQSVQASLNNVQKEGNAIDKNGYGNVSYDELASSLDQNAWGEALNTYTKKAKSFLSLACAYKTYGDILQGSWQRAQIVGTARYAMAYLRAADQIKLAANTGAQAPVIAALSNNLAYSNTSSKGGTDALAYQVAAMGKKPPLNISINQAAESAFVTAVKQITTLPLKTLGAAVTDADLVQQCQNGQSSARMAQERAPGCVNRYGATLNPLITAAANAPAVSGIVNMACPALEAVVQGFSGASNITFAPAANETIRQLLTTGKKAGSFNYLSGETAMDTLYEGTAQILGDYAATVGMRPADEASYNIYRGSLNNLKLANRDPKNDFIQYLAGLYGQSQASYGLSGGVLTAFSSIPLAAQMLAPAATQALYNEPSRFVNDRFLACGKPLLQAQYRAIRIAPDFMCNIRYSMSPNEMNKPIDNILDYMTKPHPEHAQTSLAQLQQRVTTADPTELASIQALYDAAQQAANQPYIDPVSGKPNDGTEYAKYLQFCTNRRDPWGMTGAVSMTPIDSEYEPDEVSPLLNSPQFSWMDTRLKKPTVTPEVMFASTAGGIDDMKWYSGERCTEESEQLNNFRSYTMYCNLLAAMSGTRECWHPDALTEDTGAILNYQMTNDILFQLRTS